MDAPVPLKITDDPIHIIVDGVVVTVGNAFTVTVVVAILVQPFASVPVTVYVAVVAGTKETPSVIPPVQV